MDSLLPELNSTGPRSREIGHGGVVTENNWGITACGLDASLCNKYIAGSGPI